LACWCLACVSAARVPVILDTDIGTFIDDTFALSQILATPELDLRLVVTASGDTVARARVAAKHLRLVGATSVPIAIGIPTDVGNGALLQWAKTEDLDSYPAGVLKDGIEAMHKAVAACSADQTVALISIGPHTNVKAFMERFPELQSKVRVYIMGGSVVPGIHLPWGDAVTPVSTTNEAFDPAAVRALLRGKWKDPPGFAEVASTIGAQITGQQWQQVRSSDSPLAKVAVECLHFWWRRSREDKAIITHGEAMGLDPSNRSAVLWDTVAVHFAASAEWLQLESIRVDFGEFGNTIPLPKNSTSGGLSSFAVGWAGPDQAGLQSYLGLLTSRLLAKLPYGQNMLSV